SVPSLSLRASAAPQVRPLLAAFPIPNGTELGNGLALFTASYSDPTRLNATSLRVDQLVGNRVTLFLRVNYSPSSVTTRNSAGELSNPRPTRFETTTLTGGATWSVSPSLTNEFRANWSRQFGGTFIVSDDFGGAVPLSTSLLPPFSNTQNT